VQFAAGLTRFGVENPIPVIKKRISLFGNTDDISTLLKKLQEKWIMTGDPSKLDLADYNDATINLVPEHKLAAPKDLKETEELKPLQ